MSTCPDPGPVLVTRADGGRLTVVFDPTTADPDEIVAALSDVVAGPPVPRRPERHYAGEFLG